MAILLASGEKANILEDSALSSSPAAHSIDGLDGLKDGRPSIPARFTSILADSYFQWDANRVQNGGFETSTLANWTDDSDTASGFTTAEEGTIVNSGTKALKMNTAAVASKKASRYQDITNVRAGHRMNWTVALRGDGTRTARFRILNLMTGKYWTGSVWSSTPTDLAARSVASYATSSGSFVVESYAACRQVNGLVTLRLICLANDATAGAAYADDVYLWPSWDFFSLHGHRYLDPVVTCELLSDDNSAFSSATSRATPTIYQPSFYASLGTPVDERYGRIKFPGTAQGLITVGEAIIAQALSLQEPENWPIELTFQDPDVYMATETGDAWVYSKTYHPLRQLGMSFEFASHAAHEEARDEIFIRSRGRKTPMVIVPDTTRPEVILGRIDRSYRVARKFVNFYGENDLMLAELPFFP